MRNSISLIMIIFITLFVSAFAVSTANAATHTNPFIKNGQLFVRKVTTSKVADVAKFPKGLSANDALRLYRGEIGQARIKTGVRTISSFGFPITGVQKKSVVSYKAGSWVLKDSPSESFLRMTIMFLVVPALLILIIAVFAGIKKSLVLYSAIFLGIIMGALVGVDFLIPLLGMIVGAFTGVIIGWIIFMADAKSPVGEILSSIAGATAGMIAGAFTGGLAGTKGQGLEIVYDYASFLAIVMVVSLIIVTVFSKMKEISDESKFRVS